MDLALIAYEVLRWSVTYNLILFLIWLVLVQRDEGTVSEIYVIVMTLFGARLFGVYLGIQARSLRGTDQYVAFMDGLWWDMRLVPEAIVFVVLGVVLTRRFIKSYLFHDPKYRAQNGRRKSRSGRTSARLSSVPATVASGFELTIFRRTE